MKDGRVIGRRAGLFLLQFVVPVALVAGFGLWSERADDFFFPPLSRIAADFADTWLFERVGTDLVPSLARMLAGYAISVVCGVALGVLFGMSRILRTATDPVIQFLRALPAPAMIPFAMLLFGTGDASKVFIVVLGTMWPILLNTLDGVRGVEEQQLDMARSFRVPATARLFHITLPAASPRIFAGMRTSLGIGIILMVVSEMVASRNGIGYFVLQSQRSFEISAMWGGVILLGLIGLALSWVFVRVENRVLRWHRGARGLLPEPATASGRTGLPRPTTQEVTRA
ncbi:nitrate ABC transporter permease [Microtetraspora sp. NBRC 13810]|uniref:ABC transporter permease n=1 Tax=Microtetraspora sp. NBRC 13810 TaxID=3030990 RepID=UPI0024A526DC|nr:ABC transporter permease [Microtetraspora sp. NBRC 13810]GLW06420.1 nitrate ABC transporter permease [Microtetraspora sp. NBRC 13810]